jgi:glucose-6-phosphate 1-dehydrogenase
VSAVIGPCHFVIFGATGDLSVNKLLPALYYLQQGGRLPDSLAFIAVSRREWNQQQWRSFMREKLAANLGHDYSDQDFEQFARRFSYVRVVHDQPEHYAELKQELSKPREGVCANIAFYLAVSPSDFTTVVSQLDAVGLCGRLFGNRIVLEKPFGYDLHTALQLNQHLHRHFDEEQIFRIDHYLGKETVQNLQVFRFANSLVEPIWNRNYIDHVQITVAESKGIGSRAGYFDHTGSLRDMLQNHMMQLLSVVAMEPPARLDADALQDEKVKVLRSIRPIPRRSVNQFALRAQYSAGEGVPGYQGEAGVAENSMTETYVAAKFYVDNWRWSGVPFYLRTGKRLPDNRTLVSLRLKHPPRQLFRETPMEHVESNWIVLSIQPEESMHIELQAKEPGLDMRTRTLQLMASFRQGDERPLGAYEALLLDVIEGDRSLFIRFDEVEWSWRVVEPILQQWSRDNDFIHSYAAGSWGPEEATRLFDNDDQSWRNTI